MDAIRVLHVLSGMNLGGAESMIMNYYRNIDRNKIQFDFLLTSNNRGAYFDEIESLGGRIYHIFPASIKTMHLYLSDINRFFKNHKEYRIVHSHTSSKSVFPLCIAKINKIPVRICHSHNTKSEKGIKGIVRNILKIPLKIVATDFFACSEKAAIWLYGKKYLCDHKAKIIYNAIDAKKYSFNEGKRKQIRKEFNLENKLVVGNIGRFNYQKNHDFLIDIFYEIHEKHQDSVLLIIGDGELREEIERKIEFLKLKNHVIMTGYRTDVHDLLQSMDIFLLPSHFEGLPLCIIEAQDSGLPCIVSDKITKEIELTNLIFYISLCQDAQYWADKVLKEFEKVNSYNRQNAYASIKESKYDIIESSKMLENYYMERAIKNE